MHEYIPISICASVLTITPSRLRKYFVATLLSRQSRSGVYIHICESARARARVCEFGCMYAYTYNAHLSQPDIL